MFTNAFYEPVASRITKPEQQQALFFFYSVIQKKKKKVLFLSCINLYTGLSFYVTQYRVFNTKLVLGVLLHGVELPPVVLHM